MADAAPVQAVTKQARPLPHVLWPPRVLPGGMEVSAHQCPRLLLSELRLVFPGVDTKGGMITVLVCQQARLDLVQVGPDVEAEKDERLRIVCVAQAARPAPAAALIPALCAFSLRRGASVCAGD